MKKVSDETLIRELAQQRYHTDPIFHAKVYRAVLISVLTTLPEVIKEALIEAATLSASIVLLLEEVENTT